MIRPGELIGLGAFGETMRGAPLNRVAKRLRLNFDDGSILNTCINAQELFGGNLPKETWLVSLFNLIGTPARFEGFLMPVAGIEQTICLVYADNGRSNNQLKADHRLLEIAASHAGLMLENNLLRQQSAKETKLETKKAG